jgi:hypothetical protein
LSSKRRLSIGSASSFRVVKRSRRRNDTTRILQEADDQEMESPPALIGGSIGESSSTAPTTSVDAGRPYQYDPLLESLTNPAAINSDGDMFSFNSGSGQTHRVLIYVNDIKHEFDLSVIHHTADVFITSGMEQEACRLYLLLCRIYERFNPPLPGTCLKTLAAAYRCSSSVSELDLVTQLMNKWLLHAEEFQFTSYERWFLRILLISVYIYTDDRATALELLTRFRKGISLMFPQFIERIIEKPLFRLFSTFLTNLFHDFHFGEPYFNKFQSRTLQLLRIESCLPAIYLTQGEQLRASNSILPSFSCLRRCMNWIIGQLSSAEMWNLKWKSIRHHFIDEIEAERATIFSFLWIRWLEQNGASDKTIFWEDEAGERICTGISDIETLEIATYQLLRRAPSKPRRRSFGQPRSTINKDWVLIQRALAGAFRLTALRDEGLALDFMDCCHEKMPGFACGNSSRWFNSAISSEFANAILGAECDHITRRDPLDLLDFSLHTHDMNVASMANNAVHLASAVVEGILRQSMSRSVLALSLSSSDLSSMRRTALRTKNSFLSMSSWRTPSILDDLSETFSTLDMDMTEIRPSISSLLSRNGRTSFAPAHESVLEVEEIDLSSSRRPGHESVLEVEEIDLSSSRRPGFDIGECGC